MLLYVYHMVIDQSLHSNDKPTFLERECLLTFTKSCFLSLAAHANVTIKSKNS